MKKILLITQMFPPEIGGAQNYYHQLAAHLPADKLVVLADSKLLNYGSWPVVRYKLIYQPFFYESRWLWPKWFRLLIALVKVIRQEKPDILWAGEVIPAGTAVYLAAKFFQISYFVSTHGADVLNLSHQLDWAGRRRLFLARQTLNSAEFITVNSEYTRLIISKLSVPRNKTLLVYPCPNTTPVKKSPELSPENQTIKLIRQMKQAGYKILLTVCRLESRKGLDRVIMSLPRVWRQCPKTAYVVINDSPYLKQLKGLAKKTDKFVDNRSRIIFSGRIDSHQLREFFQLSDIFIMTPREERGLIEGFGIVYLEAGSFGKPVIGSKLGGVPEAIVNYNDNPEQATGLLVDDPHSPREIAKSILILLKNKKLADKLGCNGRQWAKKFSWAKEAEKIISKIQSKYDISNHTSL